MPELRVTVREEMNKMLDEIVSAGIFNTKAEAIRAATVYFLKDLDWIEKPHTGS